MGFLLGCQGPSSSWNSKEGFKTQIVNTRSQGSAFQVVELEGVQDQKSLNGEIVEFYFSPGENGNQIKGQAPIARFIENSSGVHVPADVLSLQMVTLYYHLQELKKLEFSVKEGGIVPWPRKVGLRVRSTNANTRFDNAFYSGVTDMLYFVPYRNDQTPIPLNPGVLAHELFHSYFAYVVVNPLDENRTFEKSRTKQGLDEASLISLLTLDYYIKSVNEGLADYWGWLYSDDPDFVGLSLPSEQGSRTLEKASIERKLLDDKTLRASAQRFTNRQCEERTLTERGSPFDCSAYLGYKNGSTIARTLRSFSLQRQARQKLTKQELRKQMAEKVVSLLVQIRENINADNYSLEKVVLDWSKSFESLSDGECKVLKGSLSTAEASSQICSGSLSQ